MVDLNIWCSNLCDDNLNLKILLYKEKGERFFFLPLREQKENLNADRPRKPTPTGFMTCWAKGKWVTTDEKLDASQFIFGQSTKVVRGENPSVNE